MSPAPFNLTANSGFGAAASGSFDALGASTLITAQSNMATAFAPATNMAPVPHNPTSNQGFGAAGLSTPQRWTTTEFAQGISMSPTSSNSGVNMGFGLLTPLNNPHSTNTPSFSSSPTSHPRDCARSTLDDSVSEEELLRPRSRTYLNSDRPRVKGRSLESNNAFGPRSLSSLGQHQQGRSTSTPAPAIPSTENDGRRAEPVVRHATAADIEDTPPPEEAVPAAGASDTTRALDTAPAFDIDLMILHFINSVQFGERLHAGWTEISSGNSTALDDTRKARDEAIKLGQHELAAMLPGAIDKLKASYQSTLRHGREGEEIVKTLPCVSLLTSHQPDFGADRMGE